MDFNMTLIGQTVSFAIFVWFTMRFVWPILLGKMAEREKRIADGLTAAEQGQERFEQAEQRYEELVKEGKQQAADIIAQAQKRGDELIEEAKTDAKSEAERIKQSAQADIDRQIAQARERLKAEVAALALAGAEQILVREVDRRTHNELFDKICARL